MIIINKVHRHFQMKIMEYNFVLYDIFILKNTS